MIFNGLVVYIRMESATFGCAAVDSVEESLAAGVEMVAAGVEMVAAGVEMVAAGCGAAPTCCRPCISPCWLRW